MRHLALAIPLLAVTLLQNQSCNQQKPAATTKRERIGVAHRFMLTKFDGGVAFDTQTGQICRTWNWHLMGKPAQADATGTMPQRSLGEYAPTCISLYQDYPSGSAGAEVVSEGSD